MANKEKSRGVRKKWQNYERLIIIIISLFLLCATSLDAQDVGKAGDLRFWALNVGQGDCLFLSFPNGQNMLVDAGTSKSKGQIMRFLNKHLDKKKKIDLVVATHHHSDHIGSMSSIVSKFNIDEIWDNGSHHGSDVQKRFYRAIQKKRDKTHKKVSLKVVKAGENKKFGDATVQVLAPSDNNLDENNRSIILYVAYKNVSFLLTGDMEQPERETFNIPRATILKLAHHGSRNGTNLRFLKQVEPSIVVLSYGENNSYGHPHKEVLDALERYDKKLIPNEFKSICESPRTARSSQNLLNLIRLDTIDGDICIATDGETYIEDNRNNYLEAKTEETKGGLGFKKKVIQKWKQFLHYLKS